MTAALFVVPTRLYSIEVCSITSIIGTECCRKVREKA